MHFFSFGPPYRDKSVVLRDDCSVRTMSSILWSNTLSHGWLVEAKSQKIFQSLKRASEREEDERGVNLDRSSVIPPGDDNGDQHGTSVQQQVQSDLRENGTNHPGTELPNGLLTLPSWLTELAVTIQQQLQQLSALVTGCPVVKLASVHPWVRVQVSVQLLIQVHLASVSIS